MLSTLLLVAAASVATLTPPAADDPAWEAYVCAEGPQIRLALIGGRPAERGFLAVDAGIVTLVRHEGEAAAVLRGDGYMVRPFNWTDILYAPPGREQDAYQCRVAGAAAKPGAPALE